MGPAKVAWILTFEVLGSGVCRTTVLQAARCRKLASNLAGVLWDVFRPNLAQMGGNRVAVPVARKVSPAYQLYDQQTSQLVVPNKSGQAASKYPAFRTHWPRPQMQTGIRTGQHLQVLKGLQGHCSLNHQPMRCPYESAASGLHNAP